MQPNSSAKSWVGIDVSQDWIDVVVLVEEQPAAKLRCDRSSAALAELAQTLLPYAPQGVVLEATGGLEAVVITALAAAGLPVMRMNPARVRDFARAHGPLAKTDALDAYVLALFGARMQPLLRALARGRAPTVGGLGDAPTATHTAARRRAHTASTRSPNPS